MEYDFLKWLGHASFMFKEKGLTVYIDPFKITDIQEHADIVFITHPHFDHFNEPDLKKIIDDKTHFVAPSEVAQKLHAKNVIVVKPGDKKEVLGIAFEVVAAYNNEGKTFHPKQSDWVGYIINANGKRIYHAGDTDFIKEMEGIEVDLALLPCGGHYVMDIDEAIKASKVIKAKHFAPMHYRALLGKEGSAALEEKFKAHIKNAIILPEVAEPAYSF